MSSGAESRHQSEMCAYCSLCVSEVGLGLPHPMLPTMSMSGSFQWPGPPKGIHRFCLKPISDMLFHESLMSPVVRQEFASRAQSAACSNGALLDMLKKISRPESCRAFAMVAALWTSFRYQSYLR